MRTHHFFSWSEFPMNQVWWWWTLAFALFLFFIFVSSPEIYSVCPLICTHINIIDASQQESLIIEQNKEKRHMFESCKIIIIKVISHWFFVVVFVFFLVFVIGSHLYFFFFLFWFLNGWPQIKRIVPTLFLFLFF